MSKYKVDVETRVAFDGNSYTGVTVRKTNNGDVAFIGTSPSGDTKRIKTITVFAEKMCRELNERIEKEREDA